MSSFGIASLPPPPETPIRRGPQAIVAGSGRAVRCRRSTAREANTARDRVYEFIENGGDLATAGAQPRGRAADQHKLTDIQVLTAKVPMAILMRTGKLRSAVICC